MLLNPIPMKNKLYFIIIFFFLTFSIFAQQRHYVSTQALGSNDGSTWDNAFISLQDALANANYGDTIWVKQGVYYADTRLINRDTSFYIPIGVAVYGGFTGNETQLTERPLSTYSTLNGDIGEPKDDRDNTKTIIKIIEADSLNLLNGFEIMNGNNLDYSLLNNGGFGSSIDLTRCENILIENCIIKNNHSRTGGGINARESNLVLKNCKLQNNYSNTWGGGLSLGEADHNPVNQIIIKNCSFISNRAKFGGDAIYISTSGHLSIDNSTFIGNYTSRRKEDFFPPTGIISGAIVIISLPIPGIPFPSDVLIDINNTLFYENSGALSIIHSLEGQLEMNMTNSTLVDNGPFPIIKSLGYQTSDWGGIPVNINNSILWETQDTFHTIIHIYSEIMGADPWDAVTYNIYNSLVSTDSCAFCHEGMIYNQNPEFVNEEEFDFRLKPCSPAIDAGAKTIPFTEKDIRGLTRGGYMGAIDMGAYEGLSADIYEISQPCFEETGSIEYTLYGVEENNQDTLNFQMDGIEEGTHQLIFKDSLSDCSLFIPYTMTAADPIGIFSSQENTAFGTANGKIVIDSIFSGFPPYTLNWSNGMRTNTIENLEAGFYTLTITDSHFCTNVFDFEIGVISSTSSIQNKKITLYPSLAKSQQKIQLTATDFIIGKQLKVFDVIGKQVLSTTLSPSLSFDAPIKKGYYFVKIEGIEKTFGIMVN